MPGDATFDLWDVFEGETNGRMRRPDGTFDGATLGDEPPYLCGCGRPGEIRAIELRILCGARDRKPDPALREPGDVGVLLEAMMNAMDDFGLLEHGSLVEYAWLTDKGRARLVLLERWGAALCGPDDVNPYSQSREETIAELRRLAPASTLAEIDADIAARTTGGTDAG